MAAAAESPPYSLRLNLVFSPSLCRDKIWYAVSSEWCIRPRQCNAGTLFKDEFIEISIYDLADQNGAPVNPSWFGSSRKKDMVCVSTLFGIVARAIRSKNTDIDKVISSTEFKTIKDMVNSIPIDEMAGRSQIPAIFPETPPTSPETDCSSSVLSSCTVKSHQLDDSPFAAVEKLENSNTGSRLKMKQAGAIAESCLNVLQEQSKSCDIGKVFGYGLLYCGQEKQNFVREALSSTAKTVAQKQGIQKTFKTMLDDDLNQQYLESLRVPDWIQLYVKLTSKLPNNSWQTLLNFLNIGRSGVGFSSLAFVDILFYCKGIGIN